MLPHDVFVKHLFFKKICLLTLSWTNEILPLGQLIKNYNIYYMSKSSLDNTLIMAYTAVTWIANFCKLLTLVQENGQVKSTEIGTIAGEPLHIVAHVFGLIPQVSWIMAWL